MSSSINQIYSDLNITLLETSLNSTTANYKTIELLAYSQIEGYRICAVSSNIDFSNYDQKITKAISIQKDIKEKVNRLKEALMLSTIQPKSINKVDQCKDYPILNRISFEIKEKKDISTLNSILDTSAIDILSVSVRNDSLFELICNDCEVEIITIRNKEKFNFFNKKKNILHAIDNHVQFEFLISELINNENQRSIFIYNFSVLYEITRGRNIIFSSGADSFISQRSPFDVINMLETLFGVSYKNAKSMIYDNCIKAIEKGIQRKFYKKGVSIQKGEFKCGVEFK